MTNQILASLPASDRDQLLSDADHLTLPAGHSIGREGEPVEAVFFPERGMICSITELTTGHHVGVAAFGANGGVGFGPVLGLSRYSAWVVVYVEVTGYRVPIATFKRVFDQSEPLRRATLFHVGRLLTEIARAGACHRVHSHQQRLARWLLTTADRTGETEITLTHEALARLVGGPRHAVTMGLRDLSARGAITLLRGRVGIVDRALLAESACECYSHIVEETTTD